MKNNLTNIQSQQKKQEIFLDPRGFLDAESTPQSDVTMIKFFAQHKERFSQVYPSINYISSQTGLSEKTIRRSIKRLLDCGLLLGKKQRGFNKSNIYFLSDFFSDKKILSFLKRYFSIYLSLSFLLSYPDSYLKDDQLKITKVINYNCDNVTIVIKKEQKQTLLYEPPPGYWEYVNAIGGEPNKKVTFKQFEAMIGEPVEFSTEELLQLSQFSKETIEYARNIYNLDTHRGKQISNPFSYFYGVCQRHHLLTAKTGKTMPPLQEGPPPSPVAQNESFFEAALKFESRLHEIRDSDPKQWNMMRAFSNPFFNVISPVEQQMVMAIHKECKCRPLPFLENLNETQLAPEIQVATVEADYQQFE